MIEICYYEDQRETLKFLALAFLRRTCFLAGPTYGSGVNNIADLMGKMFTEVKAAPACIRLLNATGTLGCSSLPVAASLISLDDPETDHISGKDASLSLCVHSIKIFLT